MRPSSICAAPRCLGRIIPLRLAVVALATALCLGSPALSADTTRAAAPQLENVLKTLADQLSRADAIANQLRDTARKGPEEAKQQVERASQALGDIADRLRDDGDLLMQLDALRV